MARSSRQSKILELISLYDIETQDDLVTRLSTSNYDVTQATISRDIKELGLIKIPSTQTGKYKYALPEQQNQTSSKYIFMLKESVISYKVVNNILLIKTLKGLAESVNYVVDKLNLEGVLGVVNGLDTVAIILQNDRDCEYCYNKFDQIIND